MKKQFARLLPYPLAAMMAVCLAPMIYAADAEPQPGQEQPSGQGETMHHHHMQDDTTAPSQSADTPAAAEKNKDSAQAIPEQAPAPGETMHHHSIQGAPSGPAESTATPAATEQDKNDTKATDNVSGGYPPDAGVDEQAEVAVARQRLKEALAKSRYWPSVHSHTLLSTFMLDRWERVRTGDTTSTYVDMQAMVGGDMEKLVLKSDGTRAAGKSDDVNLEVMYSRAVSAFWDAQAGWRRDFSTHDAADRDWLALTLAGLAPYRFETEASIYLGTEGRSAARLRAEYELLLSQYFVFWPEVEIEMVGKEDVARGIGAGITNTGASLRFRYELKREFAPYFGVQWDSKHAGTANLARREGESVNETQFLLGVHMWW